MGGGGSWIHTKQHFWRFHKIVLCYQSVLHPLEIIVFEGLSRFSTWKFWGSPSFPSVLVFVAKWKNSIPVSYSQSTFSNMERWARNLGGLIFCCSRGSSLFFFITFFQMHFGTVYTWSMYHSFDQRVCFMDLVFLSKRAAFCSKNEFSLINYHIIC